MDKSCETFSEPEQNYVFRISFVPDINLERRRKHTLNEWERENETDTCVCVCVETMLLCGNHFTDISSFSVEHFSGIPKPSSIYKYSVIIYVNVEMRDPFNTI